MYITCDLHIHSKFSRATSKDMNLLKIAEIAQIKGIDVIATGDFVHPGWLDEIKDNLIEAEPGLFKLKDSNLKTRFILSTEISSIYKKGDKTRKVHNLVLMPSIEAAENFSKKLGKIGNITSDGRPILGLDSKNLLEIVLSISENSIFIPAHIWTPWFSLFGQKSGFDSIEECFEELTNYIYALETGLSSDPPMNWRWSALDRFTLVSNSDAHSPMKIAREANLVKAEKDYFSIRESLKKKANVHTLEFYPEEGKYHFDGHRKCNICISPDEAKKNGNICPVCGKPLTMGVYHRIVELADREGAIEKQQEFISIVPLQEIVSEIIGIGVNSKKVLNIYNQLINIFGNELKLLIETDIDHIQKEAGELLARAIDNMRSNRVTVIPGYDGEYGKIILLTDEEKEYFSMKRGIFKDLEIKLKKEQKKSINYKLKKDTSIQNRAKVNSSVDEFQQKAINCSNKIITVQAGPGTGKTYTLVQKVKHLINNSVHPNKIAVITFTNKACEELEQRININGIKIATFHKLAIELLVKSGKKFDIFTPEQQIEFLKNRDIANKISIYKKSGVIDKELRGIYEKYQTYLIENNLYDFDDLIINSLNCTDYFEYNYLLIDEFQDIDNVQFQLIKKVFPKLRMLFVIGDKNQSIYGFRGCSNKYFDEIKKLDNNFVEITLVHSYRACQNLLDCAHTILNKENLLKSVRSCRGEIEFLKFSNDDKEAEFIAHKIKELVGGLDFHSSGHNDNTLSFKDIAILFRLNFISRKVEKILSREGIPFQKSNDKLLQELDDIDLKAEKVKLFTFHASKGLDFKVVFIIGCEEQIIPFGEDIDEERRLLYVAATRAKDKVFFTTCNNRFLYGEFLKGKISRFLTDFKFKNFFNKKNKRGIFF